VSPGQTDVLVSDVLMLQVINCVSFISIVQMLGSWMDVSSHNVSVPALSIKNPDCHGYLVKVGNHRRTWRRRYCVLKYACLYYYIEPTSATAKGTHRMFGFQPIVLLVAA